MAASRLKQRGERERRGKGAAGEAGLVGNTWWPSPCPDSARATEPRKPEAVLELRHGARFGSGVGARERVRARLEAEARLEERNKDAAISWLGEVATEGAAVAAGAEDEPVVRGAAERSEPAGPLTLERPSATEFSSAASTES